MYRNQPSIPPLLRALEHDQSCIVAGADEGLPRETLFLTNDATGLQVTKALTTEHFVDCAFQAQLILLLAARPTTMLDRVNGCKCVRREALWVLLELLWDCSPISDAGS